MRCGAHLSWVQFTCSAIHESVCSSIFLHVIAALQSYHQGKHDPAGSAEQQGMERLVDCVADGCFTEVVLKALSRDLPARRKVVQLGPNCPCTHQQPQSQSIGTATAEAGTGIGKATPQELCESSRKSLPYFVSFILCSVLKGSQKTSLICCIRQHI